MDWLTDEQWEHIPQGSPKMHPAAVCTLLSYGRVLTTLLNHAVLAVQEDVVSGLRNYSKAQTALRMQPVTQAPATVC